MVECTFLLDEDISNAEKTKHIHWINLRPIIVEHPENIFILYHFSKRYNGEVVRDFFSNVGIDNIIPWISC